MRRWPFRFLVAGGVAAIVLVVLFAVGPAALHGIVGAGGRSLGYRVGYASLSNHGGRLTIERPDVRSLGGEPVFTAESLTLAYSLRDAFGGPHPFGISGIDLERPKLTIVHHRDGSYNVTLPASNPNAGAQPFAIPQVRVRVRDGSLGLLDDTRIFAHSRRFTVEDLQIAADLDPHRRSQFSLGFAVLENGGRFPFTGRGTLDEGRGYELSRITGRSIALAPLLDYALNSATLHFAGGVLNDVDARIYGLPDRAGTMQRHLSVTANLDHFQPYLNALAKPLRDGRGAIRLYDQGVAFPRIDGSIAGIPVRIAGAIYGLARPSLRLGITGHGDVSRLLTLNSAGKALPVGGALAFKLLVEGDATQPTTVAAFASRRLVYGRLPLDHPNGLVALHGQEAAIVRSSVGYDGIEAGARGVVVLERHTGVELVADATAPARRFPYAGSLLGDMVVHGTAVTTGIDANLLTTGTLTGRTGSEALDATFAVDGQGVGTVGPLVLAGPGARSLYLRVALDRPRFGEGAVFAAARAFDISTGGPQPALPGVTLPSLPPIAGRVDTDLVGSFAGRRFAGAGTAHVTGARVLGYPIDDLTARAAVSDPTRIALDGRYRGSLAGLAAAAGGKLAARGSADVPFSVTASGAQAATAQIHDARFTNASVAGLALQGLDATIGLRGRAIDVYAARLRLGGNDIVAQGSFGNGGTLAVSASNVDLAALHAFGAPVRAGRLTAVATIGGSASAPDVRGGFAASGVTPSDPRYAGLPVAANAGLAYRGDALSVTDAQIQAGSALVAALDGHVSGVRANPRAAAYAFSARVRQADVATLARVTHAPVPYPEGSLDADLSLAGTGVSPRVTGSLVVPEGSVNGLRFRDAGVTFAGTATDLHARGGRVTVGSSTLAFSADVAPARQSASLRAPRVNLADFNDYFDRGDTLGGSGSIALQATNTPDAIVTSGRIRLEHTRVHRFDVGPSRADWSTAGRTIHADAALGGERGRASLVADLTEPATAPLRDPLRRSFVDLTANVEAVDLDTWLPVVGVAAPVAGQANAHVTARGAYPNLSLQAHAALVGGRAGRVPIRTATLDVTAAHGRATIAGAAFAIDDLTASASGSVGLQPSAPLDLTVRAATADVGALAKGLTGTAYDVSGSLSTTLHVGGTLAAPTADDTLDAQRIRYGRYTLPRAQSEVAVTRTRATFRRVEVDLAKGRLSANGYLPLQVAPVPGIGPATAPLALTVNLDGVDLAQFADLLPKGTQAGGTLNGRVAVVGTEANPGLTGAIALAGGSFAGPQERSKITDAVAQLSFDRRTLTVSNASAKAGGGAVSASGRITVANLQDPARFASADLSLTSENAVFDFPQFFKGRVLGTVHVTRAAGAPALVAGDVAFSSTRIPTNALLPSGSPQTASTAAPLPVDLDLTVGVGNDVRVQSGPVDIGAKGDLHVGGTLAAPTASGLLTSTGGTISFYRTFQIQYPSTVRFDPSNGVIPYVDATATTTVSNPQTDVTLHVTGQATQLNVALASDPSYSREQILGLLVGAQAFGAVSGVAATSGGQQTNPFQALATGELGTLLTQNLLEPLSSQLGSAVGLNNLAINYDPGGGGVSLGAQKKLFKNVSAVFAQSFNYPQRQTIGLIASPSDATALQLSFFSQPTSNRFDSFEGANNLQSSNPSLTSVQPASGGSGFAISIQRKFK